MDIIRLKLFLDRGYARAGGRGARAQVPINFQIFLTIEETDKF